MIERKGNRSWDQLRKVKIEQNYLRHHPGSVLIEMGETIVLCCASIEEKVPSFLKNTPQGWLTAEYSMLPMSSRIRTPREAARGKIGGRTHEIQRLIGRSLRAVVDLKGFGERTIYIDCDVIQADGGTRTASITGSFLALAYLFTDMKNRDLIPKIPINDYVSAVSVGIVNNGILLDLDYAEDSRAAVDMNFVMTGQGKFIEVQGTAETGAFDRTQLSEMTDLASRGIQDLNLIQRGILRNAI
ncbi:MAG: ribonuclease PH [Smithellaceae bacterium]|nr:ribonuclease PH [Smithellaceae bacterium]